MSQKTLVLSASMEPIRVAAWEEAIALVVKGHAEVLEVYEEHVCVLPQKLISTYREFLNAARVNMEAIIDGGVKIFMPSVIRLVNFFKRRIKKAKFSRMNVFARDNWQCQYCGEKVSMNQAFKKLTYDHVVPRDQGGKTVWTNIVTACYPCNSTKANRTPEQAGMLLKKKPVKPDSLPVTFHLQLRGSVPESWRDYLEWGGIITEDGASDDGT